MAFSLFHWAVTTPLSLTPLQSSLLLVFSALPPAVLNYLVAERNGFSELLCEDLEIRKEDEFARQRKSGISSS